MSWPARCGGWEDSSAGVTGLGSIPDQSRCQTVLPRPKGCSSSPSTGHGSSREQEQGAATHAPRHLCGAGLSHVGEGAGSTEEGPQAGTWAMGSQHGIQASRKEQVLVPGPAAGWVGLSERGPRQSPRSKLCQAQPRLEVLHISSSHVCTGSGHCTARGTCTAMAALQENCVLAEELLSRALSCAVPRCP